MKDIIRLVHGMAADAQGAVMLLDDRFRVVWVNSYLQERGFSLEDIKGKSAYHCFRRYYEPSLARRCLKTDSVTRSHSAKAIPVALGDVTGVVYMFRLPDPLEILDAAIFMWDKDLRYVYVNKAFTDQSGKKSMLGRTDEDLGMDDEITEQLRKDAREVMRTGRIIQRSYKKEDHYLRVKLMSMGDYVVGVVRDITDSILIEEKLKEESERYETVLATSPDTIIILDKEGIVEYVNPRAVEQTGFSQEDIVGRHFSSMPFITKEDMPRLFRLFASLVKGKYVAPFEIQARRRKGDVLTFEVIATSFGEQYLITGRDVTERVRHEDCMALRTERYRFLYESMAQGIVYQNDRGEIVDANPAAQEILGLTLDQMQGRTSLDPRWKAIHEDGSLFPGDEHPAMIALKEGREVHDVIMGVYHPVEDQYRWIQVTAVPVLDTNGKAKRVYASFEDVTSITNYKKMLEKRYHFERMLEEIASSFLEGDDVDALIVDSLARVGTHIDADRAYIYRIDGTLINTHEWVADGITSHKEHMQGIGKDHFKEIIGILKKGPYQTHVKDLRFTWFRRYLKKQEIQSLVLVPMLQDNILKGFLGFDAVREEQHWPDEIVPLFGLLSNIYWHALSRKVSDEKLHYHAHLLDVIEDAVISVDADFNILSCNRAAEQFYSWKKEEVVGMNVLEMLSPENKEGLLDEIVSSLLKKGVWKGESVREGEKTLYLHTTATVMKNRDGMTTGYLAVSRDVTQPKKEQKDLFRQKQFTDQLIETAPAIVLVLDGNGSVVIFNAAAERVTGYFKEEVIGKNWFDQFIPEEEKERVDHVFKEFLKGNVIKSFENAINTKRGTRMISWSNAMMHFDDGLKQVIAVGIDVTELHENEEERQRLMDELTKRVDELERFQKLTVDRELKMIELKKKIKEMEK